MSDDLVPVEYVGTKPRKVDTIAGTKTTWRGKGDVQLVSRGIAQQLFDYPDIWARPGPKPSLADVVPGAPHSESEPPPDLEPPTLMERLVRAIDGLGKDGFTDNGRPRKSAVVEALGGEDVSVGDISEAWEIVQAVRKAAAEVGTQQ